MRLLKADEMPEKDLISDKAPVKCLDLEDAISKYGNSLLRLCFLYLKDIHLAEDALQETFLKAYRGYGGFNGACAEKTWITRIAINVCKDFLRKSWFKHKNTEDELSDIPYEAGFENSHDRDELIVQIMKLPRKYREVILLYYYHDFKVSEITQILGIPRGTVSSRLNRGRDQLKENLKGWYYDE